MKMKYFLALSLLAAAVVAASIVAANKSKQDAGRGVVETDADRSGRLTIRKRAAIAKKQGRRKVVVPYPAGEYVVVANLDKALEFYTTVVAEAVEVNSVLEPGEEWIESWYKFRIVETLSEPAPRTFNLTGAPETLPVGGGEFVAQFPGGTVILDGVTVESYRRDDPPLPLSQKYLLFLDLDARSRIARVALGPPSIFLVKEDGRLEAVGADPDRNRYARELESKYGSSLERLRSAVKK